LTIQLKPPHLNITLCENELAVIPKNVEHCPKSTGYTYVLMFELHVLRSRGD